VDDTPGGQVLRDGEAADLDYSHTTRVRCRSRAGSGLQRPFNSHQVSVWVSVRRRTAAPRRLQPSLNPHVSVSRHTRERAKAELERERPARDRGFESPRFRPLTSRNAGPARRPRRRSAGQGSQSGSQLGPHSSPARLHSAGQATSTACNTVRIVCTSFQAGP